MKVLIISHYLNFNIAKKQKTNVFPKFLMNAISKAGMTYQVCSFTKKEVMAGIRDGCKFIFMFEEVNIKTAKIFMGNEKINEMYAIEEMFRELSDIEKIVPIYPPVFLQNLVVSKTYLNVLPNKTKLFMPSTKTFMYYKTTVSELLDKTCLYFNRKSVANIIIKFGYSGDSEHVFRYTILPCFSATDKEMLLERMREYSERCGRPFLIIVQPFNEIISNRLNEYRCLFTGGVMSPVAAFGFTLTPTHQRIFIPSLELNPENMEHAEVITLAKYGFDMMRKYIGFTPPVLRVDVSWVLQDGEKRYYINEFEGLSGTYYFNIPYLPKDNGPIRLTDIYDCTPSSCSNYPLDVQQRLVESLVTYVKTVVK